MSVPEISTDELADRLDGPITLIDVRQPDEYRNGHVPGARLVPLDTVPDELEALRDLGPLTIICQAGGRSMRAAEYLVANGVDATNVAGGTGAWLQAGRPVNIGDEP